MDRAQALETEPLEGLSAAFARRDALAEILGALAFELVEAESPRLGAPERDGGRL